MDYENSWTSPGEGFLNEAQPVANVSVSGMSSSDAKKLGKLLPKLLDAERKGGKLTLVFRSATLLGFLLRPISSGTWS